MHHKEREDAILHAAEEWRTTFDSISDMIALIDKDYRIIRVNKTLSNAFNMRPQDVLGRHCYKLIHGTGSPPPFCPLKRALESRETQKVEYFEPHLKIHIEESLSPVFDKNGAAVGAVYVAQDISKRKEIERELADAKKTAESASRAKSDFIASMSHELRTPLNAIIGFSEVLQDEAFGPLNEKQKEYIGDVLSSGRHLLALINDILDLSKVEAGKMELSLSEFSLSGLLNDSIVLIKEKAIKRGIEITLDLSGDVGMIVADDRKVKQIVFNLLSNAVKFAGDAGKIGMRARKAGAWYEIAVWDNGAGIDKDDQDKLFKDFMQFENAHTKYHQGTGLGLSISEKLVRLHGGKIWVESEGKNKGSTFFFLLPEKAGRI